MAATTTETEPLRTYRGNCHCGAFVYEVQLPEIKSAFECNCSICHRKAYLWAFPQGPDAFKVVKGSEDALARYTFSSKMLTHTFCPTCATPIMGLNPGAAAGKERAVNIHALQGINTWELERKQFDGDAIEPKYVPHEHKGPIPEAFEGSKLYTGSCHCGAVTVAVQCKPLDKSYDERLCECNCSICERNGYFWVYPAAARVVLSGDEANIGHYSFSRAFIRKNFCKTCGVNMTSQYQDLSGEARAALSEENRAWMERAAAFHPVNVRVLTGVDLAGLSAVRHDGRTLMSPAYVDP